MSKKEKLLARLLSVPKDFTYDELERILECFQFEKMESGKTSGSAVKFINKKDGVRIYLHRPHPGNIVKKYVILQVIEVLKKGGWIL